MSLSETHKDMVPRKILVVDDEENARIALRALLQGEGFLVRTASHGLEALEVLRDEASDLVLTDIQMPLMDGVDLLRTVRKDFPGLPVIMMTAGCPNAAQDLAREYGATEVLFKPVNTDSLRLALSRCVCP